MWFLREFWLACQGHLGADCAELAKGNGIGCHCLLLGQKSLFLALGSLAAYGLVSNFTANHCQLNLQMVDVVDSDCYAQSWVAVFSAGTSRKMGLLTLASDFGAPPT